MANPYFPPSPCFVTVSQFCVVPSVANSVPSAHACGATLPAEQPACTIACAPGFYSPDTGLPSIQITCQSQGGALPAKVSSAAPRCLSMLSVCLRRPGFFFPCQCASVSPCAQALLGSRSRSLAERESGADSPFRCQPSLRDLNNNMRNHNRAWVHSRCLRLSAALRFFGQYTALRSRRHHPARHQLHYPGTYYIELLSSLCST